MLSPPTDRLHKFLAIGGLALIGVGVTLGATKYEESKIRLIDAVEKAQETTNAYTRFAEKVNEGIRLHNEIVRKGLSGEEAETRWRRIKELQPETEKLDREIQGELIQMRKQAELASHYDFMKNFWLAICSALILGGGVASFFGFKKWASQPAEQR